MTTHDTRSHLLAEIAANTEDDTLRLAFADWLDENGVTTKTCRACRGSGRLDADHRPGTVECRMCWGAGTVADNADRDRAEFVRVQCEWSSWERPGGMFEVPPTASGKKRLKWCLDRQGELLDAHPEWSRCPCPECGGEDHNDQSICDTCGGTGDLFLAPVNPNRSDTQSVTEPRTVTFARGFIDSVTCTLAEAFTPDGTPTPWAVEVVKQTPVVRFRLTDVDEPGRDSGDREYPFHWRGTMFTSGVGYTIADMADKNYRTAERAADAYALAAGRLIRRHAYKERT